MNANDARIELQKYCHIDRIKILSNFFKTKKGQYGEGDKFIGIYVQDIRRVANIYQLLSLIEVKKLLKSKIHEERLLALLILVLKYKKSDLKIKKEIFDFYLIHTQYINSWDLVDLSAREIIGDYLLNYSNNNILTKLAKSKCIWERRIAIISTYAYILSGRSEETFIICEYLLNDKEDLIHKACGWMLREVGKRISRKIEKEFLNKYYKSMPRTMLRYSIEHFDTNERLIYMSKV